MLYDRELLNHLCEEMGIERRNGESGVYVEDQVIPDSFQVRELFLGLYDSDAHLDVSCQLSFDAVGNKDYYPVYELENLVEAA